MSISAAAVATLAICMGGYYTMNSGETSSVPPTEGRRRTKAYPMKFNVLVHPNGEADGGVMQEITRKDVTERTRDGPFLFSEVGEGPLRYGDLDENMSVYEVAKGRHFMWPGDVEREVEVFPPAPGKKSHMVTLKPLLNSPKVFYVKNFLAQEEADKLVARALDSTNPYKIRRSTTGHKSWTQEDPEQNENSDRTSENAFDIDSETARNVKRRAFSLLRVKEYSEPMADGIQILRYKQKQAYVAHHDFFAVGSSPDFNWDPSTGGHNRLATVFLYLSNVTEGGQTVFPHAEHTGAFPLKSKPDSANELFSAGTWQESMVDSCYSAFAVPPRKGDAIMFYSQLSDGTLDQNSLHGGCPVLDGTKWAANVWVWNGCRFGECPP